MIEKGTLCRIHPNASPECVRNRICMVEGPAFPCDGLHHNPCLGIYPVSGIDSIKSAHHNALIPIVPPGNPDEEDRDIPVLIDQCTPLAELLK